MLEYVFICFIGFKCLLFLWKKRRLFYYASKIRGPPAIPFIGSFLFLTVTKKNFMKVLFQTLSVYRPICKLWVGPKLHIVTSRPGDVETVLTTCLGKSSFYEQFDEYLNDSLLTLKVDMWNKHRKIINPIFSKINLDSLHPNFVKHGKKLAEFIDSEVGKVQSDFMNILYQQTYDIALEALGDVDTSTYEDTHLVVAATSAGAELLIQRFYKFWLLLDVFWKFSSMRKEQEKLVKVMHRLQENALTVWEKLYVAENKDVQKYKRFLPYLMDLSKRTNCITRDEILNESTFMLLAASETTSSALNVIFTILGIHHDVQEKVYEELCSTLSATEEYPTPEEINNLDYLGRVIKECMRMIPSVPFILRTIEKDLLLEPYLFPEGCEVIIPIALIHTDPKVWPEPQKFDPDRFLPEEVAKRHRCSYIPFSYGARNCIGFKYAMRSMKVLLAMVLKKFRVKTVGIKRLEDIECELVVTVKLTNSRLIFEERTQATID